MLKLNKCERCGARDLRLQRLDDGDSYSVLCDECYESVTGLPALCADFCTLPLDHTGLCQEIEENVGSGHE